MEIVTFHSSGVYGKVEYDITFNIQKIEEVQFLNYIAESSMYGLKCELITESIFNLLTEEQILALINYKYKIYIVEAKFNPILFYDYLKKRKKSFVKKYKLLLEEEKRKGDAVK